MELLDSRKRKLTLQYLHLLGILQYDIWLQSVGHLQSQQKSSSKTHNPRI